MINKDEWDNIELDIPDPEDYDAQMEQAIRETREAIHEALALIRRQEDGPFTMTCALRDVEKLLSGVESESWYLTGRVKHLHTLALKLLEQRNEAIRQRDLFRLFAEWSSRPDADGDKDAEELTE